MKIEFRNVSRAGNNVTAQLFFDGILVAPQFHCTPTEFDQFQTALEGGAGLAYQDKAGATRTVEFTPSEA